MVDGWVSSVWSHTHSPSSVLLKKPVLQWSLSWLFPHLATTINSNEHNHHNCHNSKDNPAYEGFLNFGDIFANQCDDSFVVNQMKNLRMNILRRIDSIKLRWECSQVVNFEFVILSVKMRDFRDLYDAKVISSQLTNEIFCER